MGADEIFFGYRRQKATLLALKYNRLPKFLKATTAGIVRLLPVRMFGSGFRLARWANRFVSFATLPVDEAYMRSYSYYDTKELKELLKGEFGSAIEEIKQEHKVMFQSKYKNDVVNQMCNVDTQMFMLG
jgi:asparagine synthase (glutamine-hydrolysing)